MKRLAKRLAKKLENSKERKFSKIAKNVKKFHYKLSGPFIPGGSESGVFGESASLAGFHSLSAIERGGDRRICFTRTMDWMVCGLVLAAFSSNSQ